MQVSIIARHTAYTAVVGEGAFVMLDCIHHELWQQLGGHRDASCGLQPISLSVH